MRLPHTVPTEAFEAFRCSEETMQLPGELDRTLRAEDDKWDTVGIPEDLKIQALRVIAANWCKNPILDELPTGVDRDYLIEILPLDIDFKFVFRKIKYEHYWQRAAEARWKVNDPMDHGDSWRRLYCERHLWEYLENLDPTYFDLLREECEELLELVHEHVHVLKLRQLQPVKSLVIKHINDDHKNPSPIYLNEEFHHIPMDLILQKLPNLQEIYINIGVIHLKDNFDLKDFEFSIDDSLKIGQGVKELNNLIKFSLTRSNLTRPRVGAILRGLIVNNTDDSLWLNIILSFIQIREIDFSHCKLENQGALAVSAFLIQRNTNSELMSLSLSNNKIGSEGLAGIVHGLILSDTNFMGIRRLDLKFNPIGDEGADHLAALLLRYAKLEYLNISCCGIGSDGGMKMAEVLASGHTQFTNLQFDCTNNEFGTIVGEAFVAAVKSCTAITEIDLRICGFSNESQNSIIQSVNRNRAKFKREQRRRQTSVRKDKKRILSLLVPSEFATFQTPFSAPIKGYEIKDKSSSCHDNEEEIM
ncbi:PREDICTED: T-complex-associated testis-expressed protein 1 [Ceratosolen solmsi marchali]|uniref:T-complex-associated testis-expressed protein 1 n=1 Tax=Ceratosolen solmsi marchali TaxID=326594 RepID=A0AAJ6YQZ1_9HYME|nr:PREDICTED: T-complex-associated testis-expressed protein 1 [Ceratosolen solmsi marchali]